MKVTLHCSRQESHLLLCSELKGPPACSPTGHLTATSAGGPSPFWNYLKFSFFVFVFVACLSHTHILRSNCKQITMARLPPWVIKSHSEYDKEYDDSYCFERLLESHKEAEVADGGDFCYGHWSRFLRSSYGDMSQSSRLCIYCNVQTTEVDESDRTTESETCLVSWWISREEKIKTVLQNPPEPSRTLL